MALNAFDAAETITLDLSSLEFMDASRLRVAFEPSSSRLRVVFEWCSRQTNGPGRVPLRSEVRTLDA
jgi:hypothetical protein